MAWAVVVIAVCVLLVVGIGLGLDGGRDGAKRGHGRAADQRVPAASVEDVRVASAKSESESTSAGSTDITVSAVGDMIFGREVGALIDAQGGAAPLANVADTLSASDVVIGNLESPLSSGGTPKTEKDVVLRGRPAAIEGLERAGFTAVSLANNHMMDYGSVALGDTIAVLDQAGIKHAGAGSNADEAAAPVIIEVEGKTIAFLSYTDIIPDGFLATSTSPGVAAARTDMAAVTTQISDLKQRCDYVLVSFHWGVEYQDDITEDQRSEAHAAIDAGADAVLSEHPHVIEGIELYKDGLIAYSLGDFVFDHYSRKTGESFILQFTLTDDGISDVQAIPTYLDDAHGAPSVVTGDEAESILARLEEVSAGMNTTFDVVNGVAHIAATDGVASSDERATISGTDRGAD